MWYRACVEFVSSRPDETEGADARQFAVRNRSLGGSADLGVRAEQLLICAEVLSRREYIARKDGRDFADILFASVGSGQLDEVMEYFARYEQAKEASQRLFRFGGDVAKHMIGAESPVLAALAVSAMYKPLVLTTCWVTADCFGDEKESARLQSIMEKD